MSDQGQEIARTGKRYARCFLALAIIGAVVAVSMGESQRTASTGGEVTDETSWFLHPPQNPPMPTPLADSPYAEWARNPIDRFTLARMVREGLKPSAEAPKATLLRRVSLDLTGLPPTLAEQDEFRADESFDAYERLVDRLLASPRYGERMAVPWLNAARYADTSGYQNDGPRQMWRWRDWVIDSYNSNMPYDQFVIEQLAGDLLPNPTLNQRIATGFNRNHRGNAEGGIIPEEYAVEYVVDRVDTMATVFLGLTFGCARCHDHKYDPFTQRDFYQVFAYFNNIPEFGRAIKEGNSPPYIKAPTREDELQLQRLETELSEAKRNWDLQVPRLTELRRDWEKSVPDSISPTWIPRDGLVAQFSFETSGRSEATHFEKSSPEQVFRDGQPPRGRGVIGEAHVFDGRCFIDAGDVAGFGYFDKFSLGAWINPDGEPSGTILSRMTDADQADGYYVQLVDGKILVNLVKRWLDDAIRIETDQVVSSGAWQHLMVTYDGSRRAGGITVYLNGRPLSVRVNLDFINQTFSTREPLRIGGGGGPRGRFRGRIDEVCIYNRCLSGDEVGVIATADPIESLAATPVEERLDRQELKLATYYLEMLAPASVRQSYERMSRLHRERERLIESMPTVMVMEEMATPRQTHLLLRGVYDKPGEQVTRGVPARLPGLRNGSPNNRLGLAQWLVDPSNPLTARVAVNRLWQMHFGTGLVRTVEDFGTQGERPSHPELLDWLATHFIASGWDQKAMHRLIVTSATYRQAATGTPNSQAKDPENRLLARGPRFRLPAEMIRDQALAASGLLVERIGGPSVKPYQPEGLWKEIATDGEYAQDHGADLYRRSLYTYWKRTVAPPSMVAFDATARETCTVRETRTNTPLQALTLMNEVTFVEASRVFAQRMLREGGPTSETRIRFGFRLTTGREPTSAELEILNEDLHAHLTRFRGDSDAAAELVRVGESPLASGVDIPELAAYTTVANLLLNLDECVNR